MEPQLFEVARRTFDTPGFRGITFIESEAKSIINRVPGNSLPFNWTINPYRGCSHSCVYCQGGDTSILMADGQTKPLEELRVGERVVGTEITPRGRRVTTTRVSAKWATSKPAFQITLEDGTELVASGDHRFLSDSGWKHVVDAGLGHPSLGAADRLVALDDDGSSVRSDGGTRVAEVKPLHMEMPMYDITTGTGDFIANGVVSHNCFARPTHTFLDMDTGRDFETKIVVKVNAPDVLRRELAAKRWKGEHIAMGTNTDPYQRAEGRYGLMRGIIEALVDYRNPFSILTKGTLILRDVDLLQAAAEVTTVSAAFSIGTLDDAVWRETEPGTPHPRARVDAIRTLTEAGIPTGVLMAPVLPGISDRPEQLRAVVEACLEAGATHVSPILLHLRPGVREEFLPWLEEQHPDLVPRYLEMYRHPYGPKADRDALGRTVGGLVRQAGGTPRNGMSNERYRHRGVSGTNGRRKEPTQLKLL